MKKFIVKHRAAFFIALRYLWGRAHEGGRYLRGAAAGIAVSLIPIIVTLIVADGMIRGIVDRYLELGTGHVQIFRLFGADNEEKTIEIIKAMDGVRGAWPEMRGMGVLSGKGGKTGVTIRAIDPSFWEDKGSAEYLKIIAGDGKPGTDREICLGESLAKNIGVTVGDSVRLMTIAPNENGRNIPKTASFRVVGIVSGGYNELDALWCIISWEGRKRIMSGEQSSSSLIVKIDDPYKKAEDFTWYLYSQMGSEFNIYSWKELLHSQYSSYESTRQLLLFIMALIVVVAAVNVSSATSMLALERQRDIAVLKFTGSGISDVTGVFLWGSFLTGAAGAVTGLSLGLLIGKYINEIIRFLEKFLTFFTGLFKGGEVKILDPGFYLEKIPIVIDWSSVLMIGFFTILCSVLASWIPSYRAGRLKPMELLRKT